MDGRRMKLYAVGLGLIAVFAIAAGALASEGDGFDHACLLGCNERCHETKDPGRPLAACLEYCRDLCRLDNPPCDDTTTTTTGASTTSTTMGGDTCGTCGDVTGEGAVTVLDAQKVLLRAVNIPVNMACDGEIGPGGDFARTCRPRLD